MLPVILSHNSNVQAKNHLTNHLSHWGYFSSDCQRVGQFGKTERETTALSKHQQSMVNLHPGWHVWAPPSSSSFRKLIALSVGYVWFGCGSFKKKKDRGKIKDKLQNKRIELLWYKRSCFLELLVPRRCSTFNFPVWFVLCVHWQQSPIPFIGKQTPIWRISPLCNLISRYNKELISDQIHLHPNSLYCLLIRAAKSPSIVTPTMVKQP